MHYGIYDRFIDRNRRNFRFFLKAAGRQSLLKSFEEARLSEECPGSANLGGYRTSKFLGKCRCASTSKLGIHNAKSQKADVCVGKNTLWIGSEEEQSRHREIKPAV